MVLVGRKRNEKGLEKIDDISRAASIGVLVFLSDLGYEIGFSSDMLEQAIRDSLSVPQASEEKNRLFSVLEAMKMSSQKSGTDPRAIALTKRLIPSLPHRDVWLITQNESGGVRLETSLATIDVNTTSKNPKKRDDE